MSTNAFSKFVVLNVSLCLCSVINTTPLFSRVIECYSILKLSVGLSQVSITSTGPDLLCSMTFSNSCFVGNAVDLLNSRCELF